MEKCLHFSMTFLLILHAANAATEMKRQRNRGELLIADCLDFCMRRMPRPRWSVSGIEVSCSLRITSVFHAANAATEMERQRNRGELLIADCLDFSMRRMPRPRWSVSGQPKTPVSAPQ